MLSIDCIDPAKARIKIYSKTNGTSFTNVRDIYTMGGKRGGEEVSEVLVAPKEFWKRLLGPQDDWNEAEQQEILFLFFGLILCLGRMKLM